MGEVEILLSCFSSLLVRLNIFSEVYQLCAFSLLRAAWLYPLLFFLLLSAFCTWGVLNSCLSYECTVLQMGNQHCASEWLVRLLLKKGTLGIRSKHQQNSAYPISIDTCSYNNLIVLDTKVLGNYWRSCQEIKKKTVWVVCVNLLQSLGRTQHRGIDTAPTMQGSGV